MSNRNKLGAMALAAALLVVPFTPAFTAIARTKAAAQQESDVPSDAEQAMFTKGQTLYNQGRYDQAAIVLRDFLKQYPNSIITDLTLLWLGRTYMQMGKIQDAEQIGQRLRAIKDTPFAEIYEGELQAARREATARPGGTTPATTSTPPATVAATPKPTPVPIASPTPAARVAQNNNSGIKPPANNDTAAQPQARLITTLPESDTAGPTPPATSSANNKAGRSSRRPRGRQPSQTLAANNNNKSAPSTNAQGNTTPVQSNIQVAVNNPPRASVPTTSNPSKTTTTTNINTAAPPAVTTPPAETQPAQTGGLTITVKQVPNLTLAMLKAAESASPGQVVRLPLTVTNTGNKEDQFRLETDLPAEYQPTFSLTTGGSDTGLPILVTPQLARGSSIEVVLNLRVPETATDGQQRRFFVRAASQADYQVLKVADGAINVVAPALTAASSVSQTSVMPGDTFKQVINVRNAGSAAARSSRADFVFNPNFDLVSASPSPIAYDKASRTAIWALGDLGGRDSREITVTLRAMPDALAATNTLGRGTLRTQSLPFGANFDSPSITVGKIPRARIDAVSPGLTVTPGDTMYVPFVVRNPGNATDAYELRITAPGAPVATIFADTNGDGQHQEDEPTITQTPPLAARDGQFLLLLRMQIPSTTPDRQQFAYNVVARSLASNRVASEANTVLTVGTPKVRVRTEQNTETSAPGDAIFYRLVLVNEGSGLAKNLVINETLPDALQFVSSDPALNSQDAPGTGGPRFVWRVSELAPGDTAVLRIAVRLRPNLAAETNLTTRHTLTYQDSNGNNYTGR